MNAIIQTVQQGCELRDGTEKVASMDITCGACGFQIPKYGRKPIVRKATLATDELDCPKCGSVYRVCIQRMKSTTLTPAELEERKNRNR